mgnify:CR=1 FL=1
MSVLDIFMGDPIYDDQHKVVRRDFGVKNVIVIAITLYVGNVLMGQMKPKSGGGKMKGGGQFFKGLRSLLIIGALVSGLVWIFSYVIPLEHGARVAGWSS